MKYHFLTILFALLNVAVLRGQTPYGAEPLAHTYSIVAYDSTTGEMGAAVQSHWFSVGSLVIWGEAGVGVVATQSFVNPAFGPDGLALMKVGLSAKDALSQLLVLDEGEQFRQVAFLKKGGEAAAHTGSACIEYAGHQVGENYSVQANMMDTSTVWAAMARAFEGSAGQPLAERLLAALQAAEAEGGDVRGKQSAAILVVAPEATGRPWQDRRIDLRVEDHADPVGELSRLVRLHRAYEHMNRGDLAVEKGNTEAAKQEYGAAEAMFPRNYEMQFWHAVALVNAGELPAALPMFRRIFAAEPRWRKLVPRIRKNGLLPVDAATARQILAQ